MLGKLLLALVILLLGLGALRNWASFEFHFDEREAGA